MSLCLGCYSVAVTALLLLYVFVDVNYFVRIAVTIGWGRLLGKKRKPDETTEIYGICTTQDVDIFLRHMNNARFVRELDFARFHFYDRSGLYAAIRSAHAHVLQTATSIRYRRTIPLGQSYRITTKIVWWDEKAMYLEQQFITLSDGFVRAVILSRQGTINLNVAEVMAKLTGKDVAYRPEAPPELQDWLSSIEKSSARLRKKD